MRFAILAALATCAACRPPSGSGESGSRSSSPQLSKSIAQRAADAKASGLARDVRFDLSGDLSEFGDEVAIAVEHQRVLFTDAGDVSGAIDAFVRVRYPVRFDDAVGAVAGERTHLLEVLVDNERPLFVVRFYDEAELRDYFPDKADANFMAGLFRRAVKEALAKSKRTGGEE
ncbi:MAG: hypothetical protein AB7F50_08670 [Fimbriimonadaceae bacterium]